MGWILSQQLLFGQGMVIPEEDAEMSLDTLVFVNQRALWGNVKVLESSEEGVSEDTVQIFHGNALTLV